jgi:hypothetical protein
MEEDGVKAFLITLRPYTIHHAGKKNRSVFRSVNIIALFMQPQKSIGGVYHLRAPIPVAGQFEKVPDLSAQNCKSLF